MAGIINRIDAVIVRKALARFSDCGNFRGVTSMKSFVLTSLVFSVSMLAMGCGGEAAKPAAAPAPAGGAPAVAGDAPGAPGGPAPAAAPAKK